MQGKTAKNALESITILKLGIFVIWWKMYHLLFGKMTFSNKRPAITQVHAVTVHICDSRVKMSSWCPYSLVPFCAQCEIRN